MLLLNASGCLDALTAPEVARTLDAFVTKTVTPEPREGNPPVRIAETELGMLNSIGLANPGPRALPRPRRCRAARARRAALGVGRRLLRRRLRGDVRARSTDVTIELNLSCPNVDEAPESAAEIVAACRAATSLPLYAKLSPAAWDIAEVARAVEAAGADGLSLVNTIRGLALDASLRPRLARGAGGYSGPALKPIALAAVYACRRGDRAPDRRHGRGPTGRDALELIACGATHVALGTVLFADPEAPVAGAPRACRLSAQLSDLTTPTRPFPPLRKLFSLRATSRSVTACTAQRGC